MSKTAAGGARHPDGVPASSRTPASTPPVAGELSAVGVEARMTDCARIAPRWRELSLRLAGQSKGRAGLSRRIARRPGGTIAALLALYVCWGASVPAMKLMVKTAPPLGSAGAVFLLGGMLLGLCSTKRRRPTRAQGLRAALAGTVMLVGGQGLVTVLLTKLTVSLVSVLITTVPLWFVVLARLRGTTVSGGSYVRLIAGFMGVALVIMTTPRAAIGGSPWAVLGCCIAPVLWAAGSLLASRRDVMPHDPQVTAAIQMAAGGLTLLLLAAAFGQLRRQPGQA